MSGIGHSQLARLAADLAQRDWAILQFLSTQKYATTTQLCRHHFTGHQTPAAATRACLRVLDRLLCQRLLARLERRVGGVRHGSAGFVWHLDVAGERLTRTTPTGRRRYDDPSLGFLDHTLQVTETVVTLHELARAEPDLTLTRVEVETAAWRSYLTGQGTTAILKPDLFVTVSTPAYDDHWYLEIDRGTESLPVLLAKCRVYAHYRATGRATAEHGVFPRVLWILPTQRRAVRLIGAIHGDPELPDRLFTAITSDRLAATIRDPTDGAAPPEPEPSTPRKEEPTP